MSGTRWRDRDVCVSLSFCCQVFRLTGSSIHQGITPAGYSFKQTYSQFEENVMMPWGRFLRARYRMCKLARTGPLSLTIIQAPGERERISTHTAPGTQHALSGDKTSVERTTTPQPDVSMTPSSLPPPDPSQPDTSPHDPSLPHDSSLHNASLHDPFPHSSSPHNSPHQSSPPLHDPSSRHSSLPLHDPSPDVLVPPTSVTLDARNDSVTTGTLAVGDSFAPPIQLPSFDINAPFTPEELQTCLSGMPDSTS